MLARSGVCRDRPSSGSSQGREWNGANGSRGPSAPDAAGAPRGDKARSVLVSAFVRVSALRPSPAVAATLALFLGLGAGWPASAATRRASRAPSGPPPRSSCPRARRRGTSPSARPRATLSAGRKGRRGDGAAHGPRARDREPRARDCNGAPALLRLQDRGRRSPARHLVEQDAERETGPCGDRLEGLAPARETCRRRCRRYRPSSVTDSVSRAVRSVSRGASSRSLARRSRAPSRARLWSASRSPA